MNAPESEKKKSAAARADLLLRAFAICECFHCMPRAFNNRPKSGDWFPNDKVLLMHADNESWSREKSSRLHAGL
jgi:hypothetical protein